MSWFLECGGIKNGCFTRNIFIEPNEMDKVKSMFDGDTYISTFLYDNKDIKESNLYGPLYLDLDVELDSEEAFRKLRVDLNIVVNTLEIQYKVNKDYIRIYFSGSKGFHVVINPKVFGIEPKKDLNKEYKAIAMNINDYTETKSIDPKIYDRRRLIRLSGTINQKTGLYKLPISLKKVNNMSMQDLFEYAKEYKDYSFPEIYTEKGAVDSYKDAIKRINKKEVPSRKKVYISDKKKLPDVPCLKTILEEGAVTGNRNNTSVALASSLLQSGFSLDETLNILEEWNENKNEDPMPLSEISATAHSAHKFLLAGKVFGCSSFKMLDVCNEEECKIKSTRG